MVENPGFPTRFAIIIGITSPVHLFSDMVGGQQKTEWDPFHSSATQNWIY